jgi:signal transduction histidine kinase
LVVVIATLLAYLAIIPYASVRAPRVDSFIPSFFAIVFVSDLITAVLLFTHFFTIGSRPLLVLASGYLFSSLIIIGHVLTFPGAVTPEGLLGAGPQSAAWLNVWWRLGLAVFILGYAAQRATARTRDAVVPAPRSSILWSVAAVTLLVCGLVFIATALGGFLPPLVGAGRILPLGRYANAVIAIADLFALLLLASSRRRSILDLWLTVAVFALLSESIMVTFFTSARYSMSFYAIRMIALPVSKVVLVMLLWETMRLQADLAISNRELRQERESRLVNAAAMTAAIAHEVRQPMVGISLLSSSGRRTLDRSPPDVAMARSLFEDIGAAASQANGVFDSFLRLFRGGVRNPHPVDMNEVALEAIGQMQTDLDDHGVTIRTQFAPDLPLIQGQAGQLRAIVVNLIRNSVEAMAPTTDRPRIIEIETARRGPGAISISLRDTGPGIEPASLKSIFDPFVTTKTRGTGLGLAVCKMIVDHYGGELSAACAGSGARFEIVLPTTTTAPPLGVPNEIEDVAGRPAL